MRYEKNLKNLIVWGHNMKAPIKPNKPSKPTPPDTHYRNQEYLVSYDIDGKSIEEIIKQTELGMKNYDYLKNETLDLNRIIIKSSYSYYESDPTHPEAYYLHDIPKLPEDFKTETNKYNKQLDNYNKKLKEYNKKLEQYKRDLEQYEQNRKITEKEKRKKEYEKLKKEFEKIT